MLKSRCLSKRDKPRDMDMYYEAKAYFDKKLLEKEIIIQRQSALIMHLIKNEQKLFERYTSINLEQPDEIIESTPSICTIM
jgi:hypothetical protein